MRNPVIGFFMLMAGAYMLVLAIGPILTRLAMGLLGVWLVSAGLGRVGFLFGMQPWGTMRAWYRTVRFR